ncbi:MAG: hypothetical protein KQH53_11430 [Desulfarculaceae bacterium]|nr:hypothetical protein [Desulfarculaceae bacterium]
MKSLLISLLFVLLFPLASAAGGAKVISALSADLDGDGARERVEVVLLEGRRVHDADPWCGAGDQWQGSFELRVWRGAELLDRRGAVELLGRGEDIFFWAPLKIVTADYDGDGNLEFNLGQYGSCNGNLYRMFGLDWGGRLRELPLAGGVGLFVSGTGHVNSTKAIRAQGGVISASQYDNTLGKEITRSWRWDGKAFQPLP